ncbi:MAG: NADH-quinone oxidoreductase subunit K [Anaerolineae bacterium]|nr:NADH-quinone oxidoreductase subunit K [Anaerolineae bacterium]
MSLSPVTIIWAGVFCLLGIGLYGLLAVRNLIKVIVALQILVKMAMLSLVAASYSVDKLALGQSLAVMVMVADTIVAVIGLALAVQVQQRLGTLDISELSRLRK